MSSEKKQNQPLKKEELTHPISELSLMQAATNLVLTKKGDPLPNLDSRCDLNILFVSEVLHKRHMTYPGQGVRPSKNTLTRHPCTEIPDGKDDASGEFLRYDKDLPRPEVREEEEDEYHSFFFKTETGEPASSHRKIVIAESSNKNFQPYYTHLEISSDESKFTHRQEIKLTSNGRATMMKVRKPESYNQDLATIEKTLKESTDSPRYGNINIWLKNKIGKYEYHTIAFYGYHDYFTFVDVTNPTAQQLFKNLQEGVDLTKFKDVGYVFYQSNYSIPVGSPLSSPESKAEVASPLPPGRTLATSETLTSTIAPEFQPSSSLQETKSFSTDTSDLKNIRQLSTDASEAKRTPAFFTQLSSAPSLEVQLPIIPGRLKRKSEEPIPSFLRREFPIDRESSQLDVSAYGRKINPAPPISMSSSSSLGTQLTTSPNRLKRKSTEPTPPFLRREFPIDRENSQMDVSAWGRKINPTPPISTPDSFSSTLTELSLSDVFPSSSSEAHGENFSFKSLELPTGTPPAVEPESTFDMNNRQLSISETEFKMNPVNSRQTPSSFFNRSSSQNLLQSTPLEHKRTLDHIGPDLENIKKITGPSFIKFKSDLEALLVRKQMKFMKFTANYETAARCLCYALRNCIGASLEDKLANLQFNSLEDLFKKITFKSVAILEITVRMLLVLKPEYTGWLEIIHESAKENIKKGKSWVQNIYRYPFEFPQNNSLRTSGKIPKEFKVPTRPLAPDSSSLAHNEEDSHAQINSSY
ncbi:MAG TPA: hypothetical protein VHE99_08150 [Gammaproteobacteria bacterium]|nr:hypothetical protein [Gammaproteobacteria bacterium]